MKTLLLPNTAFVILQSQSFITATGTVLLHYLLYYQPPGNILMVKRQSKWMTAITYKNSCLS